jgi:hypothetical protein
MAKPTKNESGSQTASPIEPLITQRRWRTAIAAITIVAGLMAWYGVEPEMLHQPAFTLLLYWGFFLLLLFVDFYLVLLDLRYIHLQYVIEKHKLLRETLQDEEFRKTLIDAQQKNRK